MSLAADYVAHHLRIFGFRDALRAGRLAVCDAGEVGAQAVRARAAAGGGVVALWPGPDSGVVSGRLAGPWRGTGDLRGVLEASLLAAPTLRPVLCAGDAALWAQEAVGAGAILWIGSDLAGDLLRFRQGDPTAKPSDVDNFSWGYAGERPNYLFRADADPDAPAARPVDALVAKIAAWAKDVGVTPAPLLPGGARCALVISGDSDGGSPEHYAAQRTLLGDLPITYFLRIACAPPVEYLRTLDADPRVDLQLHPDALDAPQDYGALLTAQNDAFERLVGRRSGAIRNHGFLNDGYWGHAGPWLREGVRWSANIPGVDGAVVNGSLLPARLALGGALTDHWSLLTPFGDGMISALNMTDVEAADRVRQFVGQVVASGMPGVVTFNLHPTNIGVTAALHACVQELARDGVLAWSLADCARWFENADAL